jgi:hypothetical protein
MNQKLLICGLVIASTASASAVCVGPVSTGTGSGADWNNVKGWSSTPARGEVWFLQSGLYPGKTFNTPASGAAVIEVRKATASQHSTDVGWLSSMGDGQASFSASLEFESSSWVLDGVTGGGPGA